MQVKVAKQSVLDQSDYPSWAPLWLPEGAQGKPRSSPREGQKLPRGLQKWVPISIQCLNIFFHCFSLFFGIKIKACKGENNNTKVAASKRANIKKTLLFLCKFDIFTRSRKTQKNKPDTLSKN